MIVAAQCVAPIAIICAVYVQCVAPIKTQDFASVQKESRDDLKTIKNKKKPPLRAVFLFLIALIIQQQSAQRKPYRR